MFCSACGNEAPEAAQFCIKCGRALSATNAAPDSPPDDRPTSKFATASPTAGNGSAYPPPSKYGLAPTGTYVDSTSGLALPDGTEIASIGRRIGAFFLSIVLAIVTLGIGYVIWGLVIWGRGQTPALQVLGMRCWRPESSRIAGWWWMALRETIGRLAEGILSGVTLLISFILMCASKERRCLHDLIAGTVVLHDPNRVLG